MYKVKGKKVPTALRGTFYTYDQARQAVRRYLSKLFKLGKIERALPDVVNRTFTIGYYGFSINAVK